MFFDTIVAPITGSATAPVAIVRICGPDAWVIASQVFPSWPASPNHAHAYYGRFAHGDDGYAIAFEDGRSYSGDQTAEFFIHGSQASLKLLVQACISLGARMAEPGEFTMRAFQNGRIDLTQAEAVIDTIEAQTALQLRAANDLRQGALNRQVAAIQAEIVTLLVAVEASVDFSEEIGELDVATVRDTLVLQNARIQRLLETAHTGRILREGFRVAIIGPPNAGKSSLLNTLLGSDRAIVTEIPGTTRDVIEEAADFSGLKVILTDTAGLRETNDLVESLGVERSHQAARTAHLVWYLYDSSAGWTPADKATVESLTQPCVVVANKVDLGEAPKSDAIAVSATTRQGIDGLIQRTIKEADLAPAGTPIIRARHESLLRAAFEAIENCLTTLASNRPHDLLSVDLQSAIASLGEITGEAASEDMIERIFHDFCIGK